MILSLFGGSTDRRQSPLGENEQLIAAFGGINLDLTDVPLSEHTYMSALAFCGGIKIKVPHGTQVQLEGFSLMGGREVKRLADEQHPEYRSTLHLNSVAIMGGIEVVED